LWEESQWKKKGRKKAAKNNSLHLFVAGMVSISVSSTFSCVNAVFCSILFDVCIFLDIFLLGTVKAGLTL
jgi:hypothetical protein